MSKAATIVMSILGVLSQKTNIPFLWVAGMQDAFWNIGLCLVAAILMGSDRQSFIYLVERLDVKNLNWSKEQHNTGIASFSLYW